MERFAILLAASLLSVPAFAQSKKPEPANGAGVAGHGATADVVTVDTVKKTVTLKEDKGNLTLPVEGKALSSYAALKPGEKCAVVFRDNTKGMHQAIVEIKQEATPAKTARR